MLVAAPVEGTQGDSAGDPAGDREQVGSAPPADTEGQDLRVTAIGMVKPLRELDDPPDVGATERVEIRLIPYCFGVANSGLVAAAEFD